MSIAVATALTAPLATPPMAAASVSSTVATISATARIDSAVRAEAAAIAGEAASLRRDVSQTLDDYARAYRRELTGAEQRQLQGYVDNANRCLADVVRETARLERTTRGRSITQIEQAQARSQAAWARAQMAAEESFASARLILEPHMTLLDKFEALSDYTALMDRFENLGERIDTLDVG